MKTIKLILVFVALSISTMSFAAINGPVSETATMNKTRISEIITSQIEFPEVLAKEIQEGFVAVSISFDTIGQLVIEEINASNKALQNYVIGQLKKIIIVNANKNFSNSINMKFNFHKNQ